MVEVLLDLADIVLILGLLVSDQLFVFLDLLSVELVQLLDFAYILVNFGLMSLVELI